MPDVTDDERARMREAMIYLGVQGERLRVSNRVQLGLPLSAIDAQILRCGVATPGEHIEAGRRGWHKTAKIVFSPSEVKDMTAEIAQRVLNEAGDKP